MSFDKVLESVSKVRLSGGLVGRVCTVLLVACAALGSIGALSHNEWVMGGAISAIVLLAFPMLWRIIGFAEQHPQVAILDGAQFLKHEQLVLASKSVSAIEVTATTQTVARTVLLPTIGVAEVDEPDVLSLPPTTTDNRRES